MEVMTEGDGMGVRLSQLLKGRGEGRARGWVGEVGKDEGGRERRGGSGRIEGMGWVKREWRGRRMGGGEIPGWEEQEVCSGGEGSVGEGNGQSRRIWEWRKWVW